MIKLIKKTWYLFLILVGSTSYANINRFSGCYEKAMEYSSDDSIDSSLDYCAELDLDKLEKLEQRYTNTKSFEEKFKINQEAVDITQRLYAYGYSETPNSQDTVCTICLGQD